MKLLVNAASLTPPVTGIGRYTYNLMHELEGMLDLDFVYLYNTSWSSRLVSCRKSNLPIVKLKSIFKKIIPQPYAAARWLRQRSFDSYVRNQKPALYHEPNYLPLDFAAPRWI